MIVWRDSARWSSDFCAAKILFFPSSVLPFPICVSWLESRAPPVEMFHPSSMRASSSFSWGENPSSQQGGPHLLDGSDMPMNHHPVPEQNQWIFGNLFDQRDGNPKKVDPSSAGGAVRRRSLGAVPRRRPGKKDRHSKICTAQGIRDRRMRLSLQVARKFFDLQDMLGYDKASNTIEWLFTKSGKAIKELTFNISSSNQQSLNISNSFASDCEVVSVMEEAQTLPPRSDLKEGNKEKARRAKEKKRVIKDLGFSNINQDPVFLNNARNLPYGVDCTSLEQQPADCGTIEKLLGIPDSSMDHPFSWVTYMDPNISFMGLLGWDIFTTHERGGSTSSAPASPPTNSTLVYPFRETKPRGAGRLHP